MKDAPLIACKNSYKGVLWAPTDMKNELGQSGPEINFSTIDRGSGGKDLETERKERQDELRRYLFAFYNQTDLAPAASELYPDVRNIPFAITERAIEQASGVIDRSRIMAETFRSPRFRTQIERQKILRGKSAIGLTGCIDGRKPWIHIASHAAGVMESMAGVPETYQSKLTGKTRLTSKTFEQSIAVRPSQPNSELLELFLAHWSPGQECGAMQLWAAQRKEAGKPFASDDLVAENLKLFIPGIQAVTTIYNSAAEAARKPGLKKVGIRGVFGTADMGITIGYGEANPIKTTDITNTLQFQIAQDVPALFNTRHADEPGKFKDTYTNVDPGIMIAKERAVTDITDYLLRNDDFLQRMAAGRDDLQELQGLTAHQMQALRFKLARTVAFQYVTGNFHPETQGNHTFAHHNEAYQAVSIDNGLTVGRDEPGIQVFGASTASVPDAIKHILTQTALMDKYHAKPPYVLFISQVISEHTKNDPIARNIERVRLNGTFTQLTESDAILELIKSGKVVPIPSLIASDTHEIVEIPNLAAA